MEYYHVRLSVVGEQHDEVKLDLKSSELENQFLSPYRLGGTITVNGRSVQSPSIERLRISRSNVPSQSLIREIELEDQRSPIAFFGGPSYSWRAAARAEDVTDEYIVGPPGGLSNTGESDSQDAGKTGSEMSSSADRSRGNSVFLIHGRDSAVVVAMKQFLRSLGIKVVEWDHAVSQTGTPSPYVGDVVMEGLRMADAAVVLFTPDELVRLRDDLVSDSDSYQERTLQGQARPNVYYEAGIADSIDRRRTVLVDVGQVKGFSDASGRLVVRFDGSVGKRKTLAERLKSAGLEVDITGSDWLTDGDFESAIEASARALKNALLENEGSEP